MAGLNSCGKKRKINYKELVVTAVTNETGMDMKLGKLPAVVKGLRGMSMPLGILFAFSAHAADLPLENGQISESEFLTDMPIVLSVSRLAQPASEAPSAVTVIDREMIRASGFREIPDLFRLVPGFYVGPFSGHEQIVSHGLPNRYFGRVQVLVDGRSVYTPLWGQVPWSDLPLAMDDIERIEVTRGPNAASYGANSFLGVINIVTRHAREDQGTLADFAAGNNGIGDATVRHGGKILDWDYRVTAGYRSDDGFDARNDSKRVNLLTLRADKSLDQTDSLQVQMGYNGGTRGVGFFDDTIDTPRDRTVDSNFVQVRWHRTSGPDEETSLQFSHAYHATYETAIPIVTPPFLPTEIKNNAFDERYDLEFQRNQNPLDGVRVAWGASTRLDSVYSPLYLGTPDVLKSHLQRVFGNGEWHVTPALILNAGTMFEHNDVTGSDWSPRGALNYHITPHHTIRIGISKASRTPTLLEEKANYAVTLPVSVPPYSVTDVVYKSINALQSEKITSTDVGYIGEFPNYGVTFDIRVYKDQVKNIVMSYKPPSGIFAFINDNPVTINGVETQLRWRPDHATQFILGHSYTHTVSASSDPVTASHLERSNPNHSLNLLVMHDFEGGLEMSAGYYQVSDMEPIGDGDPLLTYRRLDARIAQKFRISGKRAEAGIVFQNVGDPYLEFRKDNLFYGRTFATFRLEL